MPPRLRWRVGRTLLAMLAASVGGCEQSLDDRQDDVTPTALGPNDVSRPPGIDVPDDDRAKRDESPGAPTSVSFGSETRPEPDQSSSPTPSLPIASTPRPNAPVPDALVFRLCGSASGSCDGAEAFQHCVVQFCDTELSECFGDGYATDEFSGGRCEPYATCVQAEQDPCAADCAPETDCMTCVTSLLSCIQTSACATRPCDDDDPSADAALADAGIATTAPNEATGLGCEELVACCEAIPEGNTRDECDAALAAARGMGEAACGAIFQILQAGGTCS